MVFLQCTGGSTPDHPRDDPIAHLTSTGHCALPNANGHFCVSHWAQRCGTEESEAGLSFAYPQPGKLMI